MVGHGNPLKVVETVLEVADVAWTAMEVRHHHQHHDQEQNAAASEEEELSSLRDENRRLRRLLEENLKLLQHFSSQSQSLSKDCPPDLHTRLVAAVDSTSFLTQLESLHQASMNAPINNFPFKEATDADLHLVETLVNVGLKEPSWWVWVTDDMIPSGVEEWSGIDNESYVIVSEEDVVDGVANFIARCILSNPKAKRLKPAELQKTVAKAVGGMSKVEKMLEVWHAWNMFYMLSSWGLVLAGLHRHRAIVGMAAKGIGTSSKLIMKAF